MKSLRYRIGQIIWNETETSEIHADNLAARIIRMVRRNDQKKQNEKKKTKPPTPRTKAFKIYHWDTFDNETILIDQCDTKKEAEKKVFEKYAGRIGLAGADKVEIVDRQGNIVKSFPVM